MFYVLTRDAEAKVLPIDGKPADYWRLIRHGWQVVWDSAPTEERGFDYAATEYSAFQSDGFGICNCCRNTPAAGLFVGRRWNEDWRRSFPYRGHLCEQCADSAGIYEGSFVRN